MENSFRSLVDQANSILIVIPSKPYFDQVSGALSLYLALKGIKETTILSATPMTVEFNRLVGVNKISQDLGNKNLLIRFAGYEASNIERVSYDIENRQFQLTVIPKSGFAAPEKSQVDISYTGFSSNLVILVGGGSESHFPILSSKDIEKAKVIHLGVRDITSASSRRIISLARPSSCDSELVAQTLIENNFNLDGDIATNLLMGIEEASTNYTSSQVTAQTFEIVSTLMKLGGKRLNQNQPSIKQSDFPPGSIPGQMPVSSGVLNQSDFDTNAFDEGALDEIPNEWLQKPKVYKGTSTS